MVLAALAALGGGGAVYAKRRSKAEPDLPLDLSKSMEDIKREAIADAMTAKSLEDLADKIGDLAARVEHNERELQDLRVDLIRKGKIESGRTGKTFMALGGDD
jgi:hypothetical protein